MPVDIDPVGLSIRSERPDDIAAIRELLASAFESPLEANLVDRLRQDGDLVLSLVAELDGKLAGYAGFSRLRIQGQAGRATGLAPVAVRKCFRRRGIAAALIRTGLARLAEAGEEIVFVLGNPDYYRKLGFDAALARHFDAPWSGPAFMARALDRPRDATDRPKVDYPPAFNVFG